MNQHISGWIRPLASLGQARRLQLGFKIGVTGLILLLLAAQIEWDQLVQRLQSVPGPMMGMAIVLLLVSQSLSVLRWQIISSIFFQTSYQRFWTLYMAGLCLTLVLPTAIGGDVGKVYGLGSTPQEKGLAVWTVLVDRYSGLMVLLALTVIGWFFLASPELQHLTGGVMVVLSIGLYGGWVILPFCLQWLEPRFAQISRLREYWRPQLIVKVGACALGVHLINGGIHVLFGTVLGMDLPLGNYMLAYCLAAIASVLPISLGGLGVREGTYVFLLGHAGVDPTTATVFAGLWFATSLSVSLMGAPALWSLWHPRSMAKMEKS